MQDTTQLASIDLGSNSFRLEIGRFEHQHLHRIEYIKETVRLGGGLDANRHLSLEAMQRGWDCLARFSERLKNFKKKQVRVVATQTLREAKNRDVFLARGQEILGHPIDVISGKEEARLIYVGVSHLLPQSSERRLVIDIGGRSTELILGQGYTPQVMESYRVGSVTWSMKYFAGGNVSKESFHLAEIAAKAVLDETLGTYTKQHWDNVYGSSGTVGAIADILGGLGYPMQTISRSGLLEIKDILQKSGRIERVRLEGLKDDRRAVLCGGLSVLCALFDLLEINTLLVADGALRQGVLYDMIEREHNATDVRSNTVARMTRSFNIDVQQARRVTAIAQTLFEQIMPKQDITASQSLMRKLGWAAQLHEIGRHIAHSDYHKHGAYILENIDAVGFAQYELHRLGLLVLGHKGKLKKLETHLSNAAFTSQLLALRLAIIACHARIDPDWSPAQLTKTNHILTLQIPAEWLQTYPQSAHLLKQEVEAWQKTTWVFELKIAT
ncbi:MAG: Ppx/GppA phosphatase family protein [Cytophagales bacterium]|nr:Ppx/GppA phosphatase family protein [Cytophagales bacterium]